MKKIYSLVFIICCFINFAVAQSSNKPGIPLVRMYFHEKIDSTQKQIKKYDGKEDDFFKPSDNDDLNNRINDALTTQVDALQTEIEESKRTDNNQKIRYLRGLNECLQKFLTGYRYQVIKSPALIDIVAGFKNCLALDEKKESIFPEIQKYSFDVGDILVNSEF